jgi:hypothetical protein
MRDWLRVKGSHVGGGLWPVFRGGLTMSNYLESKSVFDAWTVFNGDSGIPFGSETAAQRAAEERAVDYALRNVQLPDGLLTRLGRLVYTISDEPADRVDWLSC